MTLEQILKRASARALVPTELSSAEITANISAEIRARSLWVARGTNVQFLGKLAEVLDLYIAGKINDADARLMLIEELDALGYTPEGGFPDAEPGAVPPAERGSIQDLSSHKRLQLILDTQAQLLFGAGQKMAGETPQRAYDFPAYELVRISRRNTPRGFRRDSAQQLVPVAGDSWPERWVKAGGVLINGRMIALKGDEIWARLGSSKLFKDALDTDHSPFAFNSGVGLRPVRRQVCIELGLIDANYKPKDFKQWQINEGVKIGIANIPKDIVEAARKELGAKVNGRTLDMDASKKAARAAYEAGRGRKFSKR